MNRQYFTILIILILGANFANANWRAKVRTGNKLYQEGQYDEALVKYHEAMEESGDSTLIKFGLGNVYQAQEKFPEAGQTFQSAIASTDSSLKADALYNLGNALFGNQQYQEALEAYKSALRFNPGQTDYLHNLELAQHFIEEPPEQEQQQGNEDSEEEEQDQQQDQQQNNQQQEQQNQEEEQKQEEQQQQSKQEEEKQQEQQQQQAQADTMSLEDAERLLNALQMDEKQVQENLKKQQTGEAPRGKDW